MLQIRPGHLISVGVMSRAYFEFTDEVVLLQQFVADKFQRVAVRRGVDGENVERPFVDRLQTTQQSVNQSIARLYIYIYIKGKN